MDKIKNILSKIKCPGFVKKHKVISIIVLAVILILIVLLCLRGGKSEEVAATISDYTASKGDVSVTITGSGTLEANEQYDITALVSGDVLEDYFEEGDLVEEDQVLYEIDSSNAQNSLERAQNTYDDALESVSNLNVRSEISGVVTAVKTKKGAKVSQNSALFTVTNTQKLRLEIDFNENDAKKIYKGAAAQVYLTNGDYCYNGIVTQVANGSYVSSAGVKVSQVIIEVDNPGTIMAGDSATAVVNNVACASEGVFSDYDVYEVTAQVSGDISKVNVVVGDKVTPSTVLAVIDSKSATRSYREAQLSYNDAKDMLDNYTIKAPISGTILSKTVKAGDTIASGNGGQTVMAIVADMTKMKFTISVDELDIAKMEVGQSVTVTADALEGQRFIGYIDNVSIVGTTQNAVTTYPVTVILEDYGDLIPGMNVDAEITVSEAKDVLSVPLSAVQRGNVVYVKNEDLTDEQKNASPKQEENKGNKGNNQNAERQMPQRGNDSRFEGYTAVRVETGLSNSDMVEIKSGINEGQRIAVVATASESGTQQMMGNMMGGGMPGGGMPGGGMPGGGMPGGGMR